MNRTASERRHHRERVIAKRLNIVRHAWGYGPQRPLRFTEQPGRLAKYNLTCGCYMCQLNQTGRPDEPFDWRAEG